MDVIDKSQAVVGEPWGRGHRRGSEETGLSGDASFPLGMARRATPTHCSASCADCAKVSTVKGGAEEVHPLRASRALKRVSTHITMADGAGVPGARMVGDRARVRMDIATLIRIKAWIRRHRKEVWSIRREVAQL